MPKGLKGFQKGNTIGPRFQKGHKSTCGFKKGHIPYSKLHPECMIRGKNHYRWKNGERIVMGYITILKPSHPKKDKMGYVKRANLVVEKYIKRFLKKGEIVHHRNKIKTDDQPINLIAFTSKSAHQRFHKNPDNVKKKEIIFDGCQLQT